MPKKFTMKFPAGFIQSVGRRHYGRPQTKKAKVNGLVQMQLLFMKYKKVKAKLDYHLDVWWEKEKIESYFKEPKWYNAHTKLKRLRKEVKEIHKKMFYLLLNYDGNYESFDANYCISAEVIFEDFIRKYKLNKKDE